MQEYTFYLSGSEAARHLLEVVCGFHSRILGEDQILGQIKDAYELALEKKTVSSKLQRLFQEAISCGKKFRAESRLYQIPVSASSIAVNKALSLGAERLMVMGYGTIGSLVVKYALGSKLKEIIIVVRHKEKVNDIDDSRVKVLDFDECKEVINEMDAVISCTSAPHTVVRIGDINENGDNITLIDLALPRDIDEKLAENKRVNLFDIDTISKLDTDNRRLRSDKMNEYKFLVEDYLDEGDGLTVRLELPDGYFTGSNINIDFSTCLMFLIPISGIIIGFFLWFKHGKDDQVIETVEFYPPSGFNSLEIAYLYNGNVGNNDVTSLLVYLANKGYLKISEVEEQGLFFKSKDFEITKLKEYDGNDINERDFFYGLFESGDRVRSDNLYNKFYKVVDKIEDNINNKKNKDMIFVNNSMKSKFPIILMMLLIFVTIIAIPTYQYAGFGEVLGVIMLSLFYLPFFAVGIFANMPILFRIFWLGFTTFHSFMFFSAMPIFEALSDNFYYLLGFILGIISIIVLGIIFRIMPKRTSYGNEIYAKIKGFKRFLETAEKSRLELLVMDNPTYFYDILPYAYVLGVSNKWIKKFESISLQSPEWFNENSDFSVSSFGSFMNKTYSSTSIVTTPSTFFDNFGGSGGGSSGGGSGGGSSGGGSGGGGGGSW